MATEQQYIHIDAYGNKRTYKDRDMNILHCENGAAFEGADGTKIWYLNGKHFSEAEFNTRMVVNFSTEKINR